MLLTTECDTSLLKHHRKLLSFAFAFAAPILILELMESLVFATELLSFPLFSFLLLLLTLTGHEGVASFQPVGGYNVTGSLYIDRLHHPIHSSLNIHRALALRETMTIW
jgi:hypothetical protein